MVNARESVTGIMPDKIALLSEQHQNWLAEQGLRTLQGSFYTPFDVVESLIEVSASSRFKQVTNLENAPKIIDPACGTGNFLVIAALRIVDRLVALGFDATEAMQFVVRNCVYGTDVDESALIKCAANLSDLTGGNVKPTEIRQHFLCRDALLIDGAGAAAKSQPSFFDVENEKWSDLFPSLFVSDNPGFDIVIGNPPFLSQLSTETVASSAQYAELESRYSDSISKLTNTASIFFLAALKMVKKDGIISFIQPMSFLATRDSESVRQVIANTNSLCSIWVCTEKIFDAAVQVTAISLSLGKATESVKIYSGRSFDYVEETRQFTTFEPTWSRAMTAARRFPVASLQTDGRLSDIAEITGDFRDQYYGLVNAVVENSLPTSEQMKLATVGLIDPGLFAWGETATRFAKNPFTYPVVNLDKLDPKITEWVKSRRRPKVIVATQTKVLECYVDEVGDVLPSVPLSTVNSTPEMIWHIAALLSAPPISLLACERHFGAGMSADVLKLGAKDLLELPIPQFKEPWELAASNFKLLQKAVSTIDRLSIMTQIGRLMCEAYGVANDEVLQWWLGRLPRSMQARAEISE
jgi:hypothetical protein